MSAADAPLLPEINTDGIFDSFDFLSLNFTDEKAMSVSEDDELYQQNVPLVSGFLKTYLLQSGLRYPIDNIF